MIDLVTYGFQWTRFIYSANTLRHFQLKREFAQFNEAVEMTLDYEA